MRSRHPPVRTFDRGIETRLRSLRGLHRASTTSQGLDRAIRTVQTLNEEGINVRLRIIGRDAERLDASAHVDDLGHLDLAARHSGGSSRRHSSGRRASFIPLVANPTAMCWSRPVPVPCRWSALVGGISQIIRSEINGLVVQSLRSGEAGRGGATAPQVARTCLRPGQGALMSTESAELVEVARAGSADSESITVRVPS